MDQQKIKISQHRADHGKHYSTHNRFATSMKFVPFGIAEEISPALLIFFIAPTSENLRRSTFCFGRGLAKNIATVRDAFCSSRRLRDYLFFGAHLPQPVPMDRTGKSSNHLSVVKDRCRLSCRRVILYHMRCVCSIGKVEKFFISNFRPTSALQFHGIQAHECIP